jgi:hypothetical protein
MRKVFALPLIAVALLIPAGLATAALDDVKGPACADIIDSDWFYSGDPTDPASGTTATVTFFVAAASCPSVSYTLVVQDSLTETAIVATGTMRGDGIADNTSGLGTDSVTVSATVPEDERDGSVCLYATTSAGRHVFDRAPDETLSPNCVSLTPGGLAGASGFG